MKAIIGVDENRSYEATIKLLALLSMDAPTLDVVHIDRSRLVNTDNDFNFVSEYELSQIDFDEDLIAKAEQFAIGCGFHASKTTLYGSPAKLLLHHGSKQKADLICVGAKRRSKFNSSLFGSIGRALAISASQSVLITKAEVSPTGPLTALVTTDHSEYADRSLKLLTKLNPAGIQKLVLLTTINTRGFKNIDASRVDSFKQSTEEKSKQACDRLNRKGFSADFKVIVGDLGEVVESQMDEIRADLLIMGAQGEGYLGRMAIGSSALKQVVASKHSILLLRP